MQLVSFAADKFKSLIQQGIDAWVQAASMVVEALDSGETAKSIAAMTDSDEDIILQFERIGRKQIVPKLLISDFPAVNAMMKLPYSEQERLLRDEPVDVLVMHQHGPETLRVPVKSLSKPHVRQVFANGRIRSMGEQRSWLEAEQAKSVSLPSKAASPYQIKGNSLIILEPCKFTAKDIVKILSEMQ